MTNNSLKYGVLIGLFLGAAGLASASNVLTFQVDMAAQISDNSFNPATDHVYVRGSFNGFPADAAAGLLLTNNPSGSNPALYSGTTTDTVDANGSKLQFKFSSDAAGLSNATTSGYETTLDDNLNRMWVLGTNSNVVLPYTFYNDAGTANPYNAIFRVNMAAAVFQGRLDPNTMLVEVQGNFEGWTSGYTLTNDPSIRTTNGTIISSNVFLGTYPLVGSPGQMNSFKYVINNLGVLSYDQPNNVNGDNTGNNNRFVLIDTNSPQLMPLVDFDDSPVNPVVTNTVVYRVDLSVMRASGVLTPSSLVNVRGAFQGWNTGDTGTAMTNDPSASNTNIYTFVRPGVVGSIGNLSDQYKFGISPSGNSTYEVGPLISYAGPPPVVISSGNRAFVIPNTNNSVVTLPVVLYSDESFGDTLPANTVVTFSVNMTNAVAVGGYVFNPASDRVYINGVNTTNLAVPPTMNQVAFGGDTISGGVNTALDPFLMTADPPGSQIFKYTVLVPPGFTVRTPNYRYSINGTNNETAAGNHRRYIRSAGSYEMPLDTWGNMFNDPTSFGNLAVGPNSGSAVPITWTGRPGVHLQSNTNLASASTWKDLSATDGTSATNYPAVGNANFFRLIKPFFFTNYFQ